MKPDELLDFVKECARHWNRPASMFVEFSIDYRNKPNATYWNGKSIPIWVFEKTLYYRGKNENGIIFSILKTGDITGVVKESALQ